jgi:diguanylate cyclase (GGDEF)-like protein
MFRRRILSLDVVKTALAALPGAVAALVLAGWSLGDMPMTHLWFSAVSMNPATALVMICFSVGLLLRSRGRGNAASWLLLAPAAIGALTLGDDLLATGLRPDTWLFASELSIGQTLPSRVAPNAALCMMLMSAAFVLLRGTSAGMRRAADLLAVIAILFSGFALVGHLYKIESLYTMHQLFPMAAHTALCFIGLGMLTLIDTADVGLAGMLADGGPAGGLMRRLLPAAVVLPIGIGWMGMLATRAGLFGYDVGNALIAIASLISMTAIISHTAHKLRASDQRRRHAEHELRRLAGTDYLTGLPNRSSFMETLMGRMSQQRRRNDGEFAIVTMDLDGFKSVNDTLGHPAGDKLLQMVAAHLRGCVRPHDVVARLGGDEFTMLLDMVGSSDDAMRVADRVLSGMPQVISVGDRTVKVGISVGIVVSAARHVSMDALLSEADQALYRAKQSGRGQFKVYVPELEDA